MRQYQSTFDLPSITIQHDLPEVVYDIENQVCLAEDVWISCYLPSKTTAGVSEEAKGSVHGKVRIKSSSLEGLDELQSGQPILEPRDGVDCDWRNGDVGQFRRNKKLTVSCELLRIPKTRVSFPKRTLRLVQRRGIDCMDVRGRWIVTGGRGGSLRLDCWKGIDDDHSIDSIQCDTGVSSDDYLLGKGHLSDLTSCRFFPSGEVILTTSIDMSARLYSIYSDPSLTKDQDPSAEDRRTMFNPRTFSLPHSRSITTSAIIGEGREIVTACLDGRLRIWNVSESRVTEQIDLLQVIGTEAGDDA
ncbi:hypothetical protein BY996DRAFT_4572722 [Phakopsora pachyrhizi]|nr:hypothetical protein BY996DRAFT_4572722 [Phakopsora pachyrhizi]